MPQQTGEVLCREFPEIVASTLARADEAMRGMLTLPGTGGKPAFIGNPVDWATPRYNDPEYTWSVNRMGHWLAMLQAWALTGDDRYPARVTAEMDHWIATQPCPADVPADPTAARAAFHQQSPWRLLEVGIRMYRSWWQVHRFLSGTRWLAGERYDRFADAVAQHAHVLSVYAPLIWPKYNHNHLMMEMLGLLYAALMLPDHPHSPAWRQQATDALVRCCENQFTEGGGQIEGCPHYHIVCLDVIARAVGGLRQQGLPVPDRLLGHMRDGVQYMLHATRPTGDIVPWGDSDPHSAMDAAVLAMWATGEPQALQILRQLTSSAEVRRAIGQMAWDIGDIDAMLAAAEQPPDRLPPTAAWLRGLDQASARTGWSRDAAMVFVACRSPVNNGHAHMDPAGFDFTAFGKPLLVDPGRFTYRRDIDRYRYKSAMSHNCLTIDFREPWTYVSTWEYADQRLGVVRSVRQEGDRVTIVCEHENYHPTVHRRTIELHREARLMVTDELIPPPAGSPVQRFFHFNSTTVSWDPQQRVIRTADGDVNVAVVLNGDCEVTLLPGCISTAVDVAYPSTVACVQSGPFASETVKILAWRGWQTPGA